MEVYMQILQSPSNKQILISNFYCVQWQGRRNCSTDSLKETFFATKQTDTFSLSFLYAFSSWSFYLNYSLSLLTVNLIFFSYETFKLTKNKIN